MLRGARSSDTPLAVSPPRAQILVSLIKDTRKRLVPGLGQGTSEMSPEHLVMLERKEMLTTK